MLIRLFKVLKTLLKHAKLKVWGMLCEYQQPLLRDGIWILFIRHILPATASQVLLEVTSLVSGDLNKW